MNGKGCFVVFVKWKIVVIVFVFFCIGLLIVFVVVVVDFFWYKEKYLSDIERNMCFEGIFNEGEFLKM